MFGLIREIVKIKEDVWECVRLFEFSNDKVYLWRCDVLKFMSDVIVEREKI